VRNRDHETLDAMSYEDWVRTTAQDLENRADGVFGIPAAAVMISPSNARWIATVLRNHAQDMEDNRG
jgi:hypothetical protein